MIQIRQMGPDEVERIRELDVSEEGDMVYKWIAGEVVAVAKKWSRTRWSDDECSRRADQIRQRLKIGEVLIGAFDVDRVVGLAIFREHLSSGVSEFAGLWVSRDHRRQGVATRLADEVERRARDAGSVALYVSAAPSCSAVGFYRSRGFRATLGVNEELYERAPEDIHMVLELMREEEQATVPTADQAL